MNKIFSLNHDSIGTRFSGSFSGDWGAQERAEPSFSKEFETLAKVGDRHYVACSVYWERVQ